MGVDATPMALLMVTGGILMLGLGASWLVNGSSRIALRLGIPPMVVGITLMGFGTSMPELLVSTLAAVQGSGGLSLGNAIGSNIMNLLLVFGVAVILRPINVLGGEKAVRRDLIFGLLPALVILGFGWSGFLGRPAALLLLTLFATFMVIWVRSARDSSGDPTVTSSRTGWYLMVSIAGAILLVTGAELMVKGGVQLATRLGISEAVIGLTLVAFGTSLPELAASVIAALKGESELSVGNILGSNAFNLGLVVGTAFTIRPNQVPVFVVRQDLPFLVVVTILIGLGMLRDGRVSRREGILLLIIFTIYITFLAVRGS
jgi:cation:H+ antiporter